MVLADGVAESGCAVAVALLVEEAFEPAAVGGLVFRGAVEQGAEGGKRRSGGR